MSLCRSKGEEVTSELRGTVRRGREVIGSGDPAGRGGDRYIYIVS